MSCVLQIAHLNKQTVCVLLCCVCVCVCVCAPVFLTFLAYQACRWMRIICTLSHWSADDSFDIQPNWRAVSSWFINRISQNLWTDTHLRQKLHQHSQFGKFSSARNWLWSDNIWMSMDLVYSLSILKNILQSQETVLEMVLYLLKMTSTEMLHWWLT